MADTKCFDGVADVFSLDYEGRGVARVHGKTVFIKGALPTEKVSFRVLREKKQFSEAETVEVLKESVERVRPACGYYETCGGCSLQHVSPTAQVALKQRILEEQLERIGRVRPEQILPPIYGSAWHYRDRARLSVSVDKKGRLKMENNDEQNNALHELNQINQDMAKTQVLAVMVEGTAKAAYEHFESFNLWLLTVSGVTLSFEILNADKIIGYMQLRGFFWCNVCLIVSIICGLISKYLMTIIKSQIYIAQYLKEKLNPIFQDYSAKEESVQQYATQSNIKIYTDLDFNKIIGDFTELFPKLGKWLILRSLEKNKNYDVVLMKLAHNQGIFVFLQTVAFFLSLILGIVFIICNVSQQT